MEVYFAGNFENYWDICYAYAHAFNPEGVVTYCSDEGPSSRRRLDHLGGWSTTQATGEAYLFMDIAVESTSGAMDQLADSYLYQSAVEAYLNSVSTVTLSYTYTSSYYVASDGKLKPRDIFQILLLVGRFIFKKVLTKNCLHFLKHFMGTLKLSFNTF